MSAMTAAQRLAIAEYREKKIRALSRALTEALDEMLVFLACPSCGVEVHPVIARFCGQCGARLRKHEAASC